MAEGIDFKYLLLENYKKLNLSEVEVTTLLMVDFLIEDGTSFVTADLLALKMSLDVKEIDKVLAGLLVKGFLEYRADWNQTVTSLNPLKDKLIKEFQLKINKEDKNLGNLYKAFETSYKRTLSSVEVNKIKEWVAFGYSEDTIINALKEALSSNKKSLRSVDKILLNWAAREDIEKEGQSPLSQDWSKNMEETIRIAKTPWLNNDDEKDK